VSAGAPLHRAPAGAPPAPDNAGAARSVNRPEDRPCNDLHEVA